MEFLSAIVGEVLKLTVKPIARQLGYIISYRRNVKRLKDEFHKLKNERDDVQHRVDTAQRNGEKIEMRVQDWLTSVNKITEQVENFYGEESHAKTRCLYQSCPNLWLHHQLSKTAKNMTQEVVEIKENNKFDRVSFNEPSQWVNLPSTSIEGIESRISTMILILEALVDSSVNMVGLSGLGGVGKTTLAKEVAKKVNKEKLFERVVMVKVAQRPVLKEVQRQIADMVGMKFDEESEIQRASRLNDRLKQEKKLLIILDDLWERLDLGQVGIPIDFDEKRKKPFDDTSCKILLTSRDGDLLSNQMKCTRVIKVGDLSEEEAWELFKNEAKLHNDSDDPNFPTVKVAERCGRLPLAIVTVARALREKEPRVWRDALERLKNPLGRNIEGINEVDSSLKLSYDYLNNELRSILLLSAMLSHDPLVIDLVMYSVGLSFLPYVNSMEAALDGVDALVDKLKALNLLLDSFSSDHFTMHDVVRDVALSIAFKEEGAIVVRDKKQYELPEKNVLEGFTRLCLDTYDITRLPEELYCPKLQFFLLDNKNPGLKISSIFFKSMQELRVINFTNMHFSSLPSSLGLLEEVKTLCLHSCTLEDIAEVGKLKNLKVLSLVNSVITRLPSELRGLNSLQMLNLAHCSKLEVIPPKLLSSLKRLEVLNMESSFNKWEDEGSSKGNDNASLVELMHLPNLSSVDIHIPDASILPKGLFSKNLLKRYRIFIGQNWEWFDQYETSKTLKLKLERSIRLEHRVRKLLEGVEDLYLDGLYAIDNVICHLDGRGFPHLKHLCIENNDQIEYVINSTGFVDAFPNLETLDLFNLNGLKKLCQGQITAKSFQKLRVIKVNWCDQLEVLFSTSMVRLFDSLVEIDITECKSINKIVVSTDENMFQQNFTTGVIIFHQLRSLKMDSLPTLADFFFEENTTNDGDNQVFKSFFSNKVSFPNLEILEISHVNIQYIWSNQLPHNSFSNLKTLVMKDCGFLGKLISLHVLKCLINLEELEVRKCSLLEMVFDLEELKSATEEIYTMLVGVPLKKLVLWDLPELKHVWSNDSKGIVAFPKLEILEMYSVNIQYIWSNQLLHNSFSNLKTLVVEECDFLVKLIPLHILKCLTNLEELKVSYCNSLEMVFDFEELNGINKEIHSFPVAVPLKNLRLWYLPELKHVWSNDSKGIVSFQSLRHVDVDGCGSLTSMFPASIAKSLLDLEELTIKSSGMEVIVAKDEVLESVATFEFPKLTSLTLKYLDNMKNFYPHTHLLECPCLRSLEVKYCDELEIFGKEISSSSRLQEEKAHHTKYSSFFLGKQIPNLEKLSLGGKHATMIWNGQFAAHHFFHNVRVLDLWKLADDVATFPYGLLNRFPNLEELRVGGSSIEEIFSCTEALGDDAGQIAPFRELSLGSMEKLKHIWNERSQMDRFLQNLQSLNVLSCSALINLGPSSVSLKNLTDLQVYGCHRLLNLLTSSTARSLEQLTRLEISWCDQIEEIITKEGEDVKKGIVFRKLKHLKLVNLPCLKSFCSHNYTVKFPLLNEVTIDYCPNLKGIEMIRNEKRWKINF